MDYSLVLNHKKLLNIGHSDYGPNTLDLLSKYTLSTVKTERIVNM